MKLTDWRTLLREFLVYFVVIPLIFAIAAYSFFSGDAAWIVLALVVIYVPALLVGIWVMATNRRRREARDRAREDRYLEQELEKHVNDGEEQVK